MINFFVNESEGVVVAKLEGCKYDAMYKLLKKYPWLSYSFEITPLPELRDMVKLYHLDEAYISDQFVRKCRVKGDDVFDENYGKKLASKNVCDAHNDAVKRAIKRWEKKFFRTVV